MQKNKEPFSFYFPIQLGSVGLTVYLDENLHVTSASSATGPHSHHIYELRYIEHGECKITVGQEDFSVPEGAVILTHPNEYHYLSGESDASLSLYVLRFGLEELPQRASLGRVRAREELLLALSTTRIVEGAVSVGEILKRLDGEMRGRRAGYVSALVHLSSLALTELARLFLPEASTVFPPEDLKYQGLMLTRLEQFFSWRHGEKGIKIGALAKDIGLSERQTGRIISEVYGMSFSKKLSEVRIQKAKYQLKSTELPIEKISDMCGFNNSSYFHMCFKAHEGITPTEYRRRKGKKC